MKKYDYLSLKAAQVTLRNAAERKGSWWKTFSRYAEIAKRKIRRIEVGLLALLILIILIFTISGCYSIHGIGKDLSTWSSPYIENNNK